MAAVVRRGTELVGLAVGQDARRDGHRGDLARRHVLRHQDIADLGVGGVVEDLEGAVDLVTVRVDEGVAQGRGRSVDDIVAAVGEVRRAGFLLGAGARPVVVVDDQLGRVGRRVRGVHPLPLRGQRLIRGAQAHVAAGGLGGGPLLNQRGHIGVDPAVGLGGARGVAAGLGGGGLLRRHRGTVRPAARGGCRTGGPHLPRLRGAGRGIAGVEVPQAQLGVEHERVLDRRGVPGDERLRDARGAVGILGAGVAEVQLDIVGPVDGFALLDIGVEDVAQRRGGRVHRHRVLGFRVRQELRVRRQDQVHRPLALDDLHVDLGPAGVLAGYLVDRGVPHHRSGHDCLLLALLVGEEQAAVLLLGDLQALGLQRQGIGVAASGGTLLDLDVLLEPGTRRLDDHVRARHSVDVLGTRALQLGSRQPTPPLQGDLLISFAKGDQVDGLGRLPSLQRGSRRTCLPRQPQSVGVSLGLDRPIRSSDEIKVDITPVAAVLVMKAHGAGGQLGRERPVLVDPSRRRLRPLRQGLHTLARQAGSHARRRNVSSLRDTGLLGSRDRLGGRRRSWTHAVEQREGHGRREAACDVAQAPPRPDPPALIRRGYVNRHDSSVSSLHVHHKNRCHVKVPTRKRSKIRQGGTRPTSPTANRKIVIDS